MPHLKRVAFTLPGHQIKKWEKTYENNNHSENRKSRAGTHLGGGDVEGDGGNGEAVVESDGGGDVGGGDVGGGDVGGVGGGAGIRNQAWRPSIEFEPSIRAYVSSHRVELLNILPKLVTELVSPRGDVPVNDVAEPNISFITVTELTSHAEMSALKETARETCHACK